MQVQSCHLSSWFKDYLYIPLGGSKVGLTKAVRNTFIIFLVSGFWHGASWNFIIWGFLHACGFLPLLLTKRNRKYSQEIVASDARFPSVKELLLMLGTFIFITFAWIFFRADTLNNAFGFIEGLFFNWGESTALKPNYILAYILILLLIDWYLRLDERSLRVPANRILRYVIYMSMTFAILFKMDGEQSFIYFQF
jgi:D-alanyl-lipoteichoic acid acyltransferase DltB (MBOAT superfamily)